MADVQKVIDFSRQAHANQTFKEYDYFSYHICGVLALVQEDYTRFGVTPQIAMLLNTVAVLHNVVSDTHKSFADIFNLLKEAEYDPNETDIVIRSLMLLTKDEFESYDSYIDNLLDDTLARIIKKADATFNMRECVADGNYDKAKRYLKVLCKVSEKENEN